MQRSIDSRDWLTVHYLPAYAPDLNPVEQVWSHLNAPPWPTSPPSPSTNSPAPFEQDSAASSTTPPC
ncbi:transposase [Streptomyces sp. PA03-1a]|nr:transposase [Streptomyces sp. PA03-1a]